MYTLPRFYIVLAGMVLACAAGAQALPEPQPPPDQAPVGAPAQPGPYPAGPPDQPGPYNADPAAGPTQPDQPDPPSRVARLGYLSGNVSFTPAGETQWVEAQVNRPMATGDRLWTDNAARAELQIGDSTVRLNQGSNFDFLNLNDQLAQMELTQGSLNLEVHRLHGSEVYEVDTPTIAFTASRVGDFRIDVDPQGYTVVSARRGGGDVIGDGGKRIPVNEGQSVRFNDSQLSDFQVSQIGPPDAFDNFCIERGQRHARANPNHYVSSAVVGYEDLDQYGTWAEAPEYGHVWYPNQVAADWAPYHDGSWIWMDPWGWTWVDNSPWGFAPFHYGRWAYVDSRWGWVPGPAVVTPVYAPALVAFVGGGGFSVGVSVGGPVGWFALGPSDVYFPGYHCGHDYFSRVNVGNAYVSTTVVNNYYGSWSSGHMDYAQVHYANRATPGAVAAMSGAAFVAGRTVASAAVPVNTTTLANARVMARPAVMPTRASVVAGRGQGTAPPQAVMNRSVVAAHQPPPPRPAFEQRQALVQQQGGAPLTTTEMRTLAARTGNAARATPANQNVRVVEARGAATPATTAAAQQNIAQQNAVNNRPGNERGTGPQANRTAAQASGQANTQQQAAVQQQQNAQQHVRSAGFAHQGVVPGTQPAGPAQARTNGRAARQPQTQSETATQARANGRGNAPNANAPRETGAAQTRVSSSTYAHGQNGRADGNQPQHQASAAATRNAETQRSRGTATASTQHGPPQSRSTSAQASHANAQHGTQARSVRSEPQMAHAQAQQHAPPQRQVQQHAAPVQHGPPQRSEVPPRQVAHGPQQPPAHAPPQNRGQPREMARSAPQKAPPKAPPKKEKDNGG
jgi:hypothetical protein